MDATAPSPLFRSKLSILAGLALSSAFGLVTPALGVPQIDQEQTVLTSGSTTQSIGSDSEQILAQTVTAGLSGMLVEVRLPVGCASGDNLVVEIQQVTSASMEPSGLVLSSETFTSGDVGSVMPARFKRLPLSHPVAVSAGGVFAIVLKSAGFCAAWPGPAGDAYVDGEAFFNARPSLLGVWDSPATFSDLAFQTIVETETGPDPLAKSVVDQEQTSIDDSVGGLAIGGASEQILAQVVTAGVAGDLSAVALPVACDTGSSLVVEVQGVDPTTFEPDNLTLTTQTIAGSALPSFFPATPTLRPLVLSTPVSFAVGDMFAIVLKSAGLCAAFQGPVGDPYAGGEGYFDARPNALGVWEDLWLGSDRHDLPFRTYVD